MFIAPCLFKAFPAFGKSKIGQPQCSDTINIGYFEKLVDSTAHQQDDGHVHTDHCTIGIC